jgi:hypothetical protein
LDDAPRAQLLYKLPLPYGATAKLTAEAAERSPALPMPA